MGESGVPYLEAVQRSRRRWIIGAIGAVVVGLGLVAALTVAVFLLVDALDRGHVAVKYIEDTNDQQLCVDKIEGEWQESISNVVLFGFTRSNVDTPPVPSELAKLDREVRAALRKLELQAKGELCPKPKRP